MMKISKGEISSLFQNVWLSPLPLNALQPSKNLSSLVVFTIYRHSDRLFSPLWLLTCFLWVRRCFTFHWRSGNPLDYLVLPSWGPGNKTDLVAVRNAITPKNLTFVICNAHRISDCRPPNQQTINLVYIIPR